MRRLGWLLATFACAAGAAASVAADNPEGAALLAGGALLCFIETAKEKRQ